MRRNGFVSKVSKGQGTGRAAQPSGGVEHPLSWPMSLLSSQPSFLMLGDRTAGARTRSGGVDQKSSMAAFSLLLLRCQRTSSEASRRPRTPS